MAKTERNQGWSGFFRAFTVLCAIMLLLAQSGIHSASADTRTVLTVYQGLTTWTIPALFMLWGMSALAQGGAALSATLTRLVLPAFVLLVFWGALYALAGQLLGGGTLSWGGVWAALVSAARGNTHFHLWVLYPLIGLYLVHPVLHRFTASASRGEVGYFLALCFLFASLVPMWSRLFPNSVALAMLERLGVHLVLGWTGCYVAGWYLSHYTIGRLAEFVIYLLGVAGLVLTLMGDAILGGGTQLWLQYTAPNVVLTALALCTLFRYVLGVSEERSRRSSVNRLGEYAVGIYLFHQLWVLVFAVLGVSMTAVSPVVSVPFFGAVLFLLSAPFAWLLYRLPGIGGYLT